VPHQCATCSCHRARGKPVPWHERGRLRAAVGRRPPRIFHVNEI
jgi:hypothetical protein